MKRTRVGLDFTQRRKEGSRGVERGLCWLYNEGMSKELKKHWDRYTVSGNIEAE